MSTVFDPDGEPWISGQMVGAWVLAIVALAEIGILLWAVL